MKTLRLTGKVISLSESERLMEENFSEGTLDALSWITVGSVSWKIRDGALEGIWGGGPLEHGQLFSTRAFAGDILMEFWAEAVPPSDHDIIWWWQTELNEDNTCWKRGCLGCLGGWWENKAGIERLDGQNAYAATTPLFHLESGRKYKIHTGSIDGTAFIFVDGQLIMESQDPDPVDPKKELRIGFGVYQSHIRIRNLYVCKPAWQTVKTSY